MYRSSVDPLSSHILLQDQTGGQSRWMRFSRPIEILETRNPDQVQHVLEQVAARVAIGLYAAGFVSYEAASGFDDALVTQPPGDLPLVWFMLCTEPEEQEAPRVAPDAPPMLLDWQPSVERAEYDRMIGRIHRHIADGDTYQVNYTMRLRSRFDGSSTGLFAQLLQAQKPMYAAYASLPHYDICSVSPELFFSLENGLITCKPMKGTAPRGLNVESDEALSDGLKLSEKNCAENVMIVDMIRNDLGRLAKTGSVQADQLFAVERYPTVHQMTSIVSAKTEASIAEIMRTMFPCASITGAPKASAMKIISDLEGAPRGIYTGAIGFVAPDGRAQFNVAIRTVLIDKVRQQAEYGVGGGIVWDSQAADEYQECLTKAAMLVRATPPFELLETVLYKPGTGFVLLDEHLKRLQQSAAFFDWPLAIHELRDELDLVMLAAPTLLSKIRIQLRRDGRVSLQCQALGSMVGREVALADHPVNCQDLFVYHKTTHRNLYTDSLNAARQSGKAAAEALLLAAGDDGLPVAEKDVDDVILINEDGYFTESTIANLVVDTGSGLMTPPLSHGLLNGVFRRHLLESGVLREQALRERNLHAAQRLWLINSVRGWMALKPSGDNRWTIVSEGSHLLVPE